ncbi:MAG TPA: ATP-binding cassette domain-containing protein [Chthoniobacteraceae bacterium]|nr:ATP-binding cassette domain-containing protein [Chthoniobacteraceae bacterium]
MNNLVEQFGNRVKTLTPVLTPFVHRLHRSGRKLARRLMRKPRTVTEGPNLLPLLIQVLAAFSKVDGQILEEEIDSSLGFLRHDYPEAVYSELRKLFRQALNEQQDLIGMAQKLSHELSTERKIMLGVQLYDLINKSNATGGNQLLDFYSFMSELGMAAQAIDIVYQLNASDNADPSIYQKGASPLEALCLGFGEKCDVAVKSLNPDERVMAYRYHDLILFKNQTHRAVFVRGRPLQPGQFCRVYEGQRILVGEQVLTHQDLVWYFNAKKNVVVTHFYLSIRDDEEVDLERSRTRDSCLEVRFGLKVQIKVLRKVNAALSGVPLRVGTTVEGTLDETITFANGSELPLAKLRRKARAMGSRFQLKAHKNVYLVSNDPGLLGEDDILLSPGSGGDLLLRIECNYENRVGYLEVLQADRPILIGDTPVRNGAPLADGDIIRIDTGQVLRCDFSEQIIEEERYVISELEARDLTHRFGSGAYGLDGISFSVSRGEMVCVMGASGSGKSTLLRVLAGQLRPNTQGQVFLNNASLFDDLETLKHHVTYIPQDDAFDDHLTIGENLNFAAAIRSPHLSTRDRKRRIDAKLAELGLAERRDSIVGSPVQKTLSGGERKRLNIGLDMIGGADVFLFDEPTSGLSSKDAEHVIEIIRAMAQTKIVMVTIHQPTSKIFQMFNKAMLLDKGGKLVFYGTPREMLEYFAEAEHEHHFGTELGGCPSCGTTRPEFIFDVLETPLRDLSGDIIYEENNLGQLIPARRHSPEFWRDKYEAFRLLQDVRQIGVRQQAPPTAPSETAPATPHHHPSAHLHQPYVPAPEKRERFRWRDEWTQFQTLLRRAFISKMRNRANLLTTIVEAPVLATLIGSVLLYSEEGAYDFASAYHIPTYLFLSLIVAMFLGLTNSADDIIRDRTVLRRERNLNVRLIYYITAKVATLALFAAVQCAMFTLIGNAILEVRGMFWIYFFFNFVTAITGITMGLFISALVADGKTAANLVPLILIPQIILGGALIKYEEMNRNLDFIYTINRWFSVHPEKAKDKNESALQVPFLCQFMPMRWSYEALVVAQNKWNPLTSRQIALQREIDAIVHHQRAAELTEGERERLDDLKDTLALLSGLEGQSVNGIFRSLHYIDAIIDGAPLNPDWLKIRNARFSAENLFTNQKISDLVSKAESEQRDYRRDRRINVFFSPEKFFHFKLGKTEYALHTSVMVVNTLVLGLFSLGTLGGLWYSLRRQLRTE